MLPFPVDHSFETSRASQQLYDQRGSWLHSGDSRTPLFDINSPPQQHIRFWAIIMSVMLAVFGQSSRHADRIKSNQLARLMTSASKTQSIKIYSLDVITPDIPIVRTEWYSIIQSAYQDIEDFVFVLGKLSYDFFSCSDYVCHIAQVHQDHRAVSPGLLGTNLQALRQDNPSSVSGGAE
ncbi:unnamed protein product [Protopolystoma xenopodis]|uniref:Uncharacterized protein n=1 Tax=Protopolystoma xenopodis TaxID=117903 RepID=A0A3S5BDC6_9PLAT|nr:unnamed protein product [Protopolystoma xenopodis]